MLNSVGQRQRRLSVLSLYILLFSIPNQLVYAADEAKLKEPKWQEVPDNQRRLEDKKKRNQKEVKSLPKGVYNQGQGKILGAFGLLFDQAINKQYINKNHGWTVVPHLPGVLAYTGKIKPFDMTVLSIKPPSPPKLLKHTRTEYIAYLDFQYRPLWLRAEKVPDIATVLAVLRRKYGIPDRDTDKVVEFRRGDTHLEILINGSTGTLNYYNNARFQAYLKDRNRRLRQKFKDEDRIRLNPREKNIMALADQMVSIRQDLSHAFGLGFGRRVGFRATPDAYVDFTPSEPINGLPGGHYKIMVSPQLVPVSIRYIKQDKESILLEQKLLLDQALEIAFGGFLKRTAKHSVLSLKGMTISLIVRQGEFIFSVMDGAENKEYNKRLAAKERAAKEARELAERKREIESEDGF